MNIIIKTAKSRQDLVLFLRKKIHDSTGSSYKLSSSHGKYDNLLKIFFECRKCRSKCLVIFDSKLGLANIYQNNVIHDHTPVKMMDKNTSKVIYKNFIIF